LIAAVGLSPKRLLCLADTEEAVLAALWSLEAAGDGEEVAFFIFSRNSAIVYFPYTQYIIKKDR